MPACMDDLQPNVGSYSIDGVFGTCHLGGQFIYATKDIRYQKLECNISWTCQPLLRNNDKSRFMYGSPTKHGIILMVTGILGRGAHTQNMIILKY